jgi:ketosteroid isomerase-like protein
MRSNLDIVQELLKGATQSQVINALVADDAVYVSLTYDNPDLKKVMPWAGEHKNGKSAILKTLTDVNRYWTVVDFDVQQTLDQGDHVAIFGSFTLRSTKLKKQFTSPFSILATVRNGRITYMQYMEDTFGTGSTFRSGGNWVFQSDPAGGEVEV